LGRLAAILFLLGASASLEAQQPFLTDDPNVTPRGKLHFEGYNQFAVLSVVARPGLSQDTTNLVLQYGLLERVEVNVDIPLLVIVNDRSTANAFGLGDLDFAAKVRILDETPGTLWPAVAVTVAVELPTGIASRGLGSGFTDFGVNTIYQKTLAKGTALQANLGYQFNGNTLTGDIGIRTPGRILSGGVSVAHDMSPSLRLGLDLNGALIKDTGPGGRQLQLTAGGNYALSEDATLDFALAAGWFGSPRFALLVGVAQGF
jgi:Putative MetA-pathway of phenol degradation